MAEWSKAPDLRTRALEMLPVCRNLVFRGVGLNLTLVRFFMLVSGIVFIR